MHRPRAPRLHRSARVLSRLAKAWRELEPERRLAAIASFGLFLSLFLPWYQQTVLAPDKSGSVHSASVAVTGFGAFSFVEAAVMLVAVGVLTLLFQRSQGRAFHLPGGDGWVILAAGGWTCVLVIWRIFDKNGVRLQGIGVATTGVEWGIFAALAVAGLLTYSGSRIRRARIPEPPLPEDDIDFALPPRTGRRRAETRVSRGEKGAARAETRAARTAARAARGRPATPSGARSGRTDMPATPSGARSGRTDTPATPSGARSGRTDVPATPAAKRSPRPGSLSFPAPEPLADPPTLRLSDRRRPPTEATEAHPLPPAEPPARRSSPKDQLSIEFEDER